MAGSTIVTFKTALLAALQGLPGLSGVQVDYADNPAIARRERVFFGAVETNVVDNPVMRAGRIKREENYTVHIHVQVVGKPSAVDNETRAVALVTAIEEYLADNPQPTPVVLWSLVDAMEMGTLETTDGPVTEVDIAVAVKARVL